tara:strand:+ start:1861 stop:2073 length:213 start_codon:yes stop_codon:yes gene_type:complete
MQEFIGSIGFTNTILMGMFTTVVFILVEMHRHKTILNQTLEELESQRNNLIFLLEKSNELQANRGSNTYS